MKQTAGTPRDKSLLRYLRASGKYKTRFLIQRTKYKLP